MAVLETVQLDSLAYAVLQACRMECERCHRLGLAYLPLVGPGDRQAELWLCPRCGYQAIP